MLSGISVFPHYTNKKSKLTEEENEEARKQEEELMNKMKKD